MINSITLGNNMYKIILREFKMVPYYCDHFYENILEYTLKQKYKPFFTKIDNIILSQETLAFDKIYNKIFENINKEEINEILINIRKDVLESLIEYFLMNNILGINQYEDDIYVFYDCDSYTPLSFTTFPLMSDNSYKYKLSEFKNVIKFCWSMQYNNKNNIKISYYYNVIDLLIPQFFISPVIFNDLSVLDQDESYFIVILKSKNYNCIYCNSVDMSNIIFNEKLDYHDLQQFKVELNYYSNRRFNCIFNLLKGEIHIPDV